MSTKMREVRARRRIAAARQASEKVQESNKPASGEAVRVPLPRAKSAEPNATAANDPFQPLVLVPPAKPAAEPQGFDLFDIFGSASSTKKWLKQREQTR